ncbi:hypothetical protein [uncultured Shewanella sp.]|uniref:hypothetical protein n=1 Tax=uncultured Shewanella sp. TaxID=173975 RepID=UPI00262E9ECD|nr:hypothetical protein [uncultured Shewanella sp.]
MIDYDYLTTPINDKDTIFDKLKTNFIEKAKSYIEEVYAPISYVKRIGVQYIDSDEYVNVYRKENNSYIIEFGKPLLNSIYNLSKHISSNVSEYFEANNENSVRAFCFDYISWLILNHELSHIGLGHIDYIISKGEVGYIEISGRSIPTLHLSDDLNESQDIWRAFETEADSIAFSTSLATLKYINSLDEWGNWDLEKILTFHGIMNCSVFYLFNILTNNNDDFKHLRPSVRQYVTLSCLDKLAEQKGFKKEKFTDVVTLSNVKALIDIFGLKISPEDTIEAFSWMTEMDALLKKSNINEFRRYNKEHTK